MPRSSSSRMPCLPAGFRFHPTDEELIVHYLMNQAASIPCPVPIIAEVNIYQCNPWDLPPKALFGENEWYFFSPRDRKYPNGARPNRAAGSGYWKATGTDKAIMSAPTSENVGVKKALVFYRGKPPRGVKTDWIMHEYRLTSSGVGKNNSCNTKRRGSSSSSMRLDDWVLCRIYKKSNNFQFSDQDQQEGSTVEEDTSSLNNNMTNSPKSEEAAHQHDAINTIDDHHQLFPPPPTSTSSMMTKSCSLTDLLNTIDYSTLSQLLLGAPPPEIDESPLIYTTPACQQPQLNVNDNIINTPQGDADYYGAGYYNSLKRKRVMTTTDGGARSSFDDGGSGFTKKLQMPPSDSRSGSSFFGSYCNQLPQLAEAASSSSSSSSFPQYSGGLLPSHPFLNQQMLLMNNHLEMQQ